MSDPILAGCYYPGCDAPHPDGKKFCGSDHKHLSPTRMQDPDEPDEDVCHCGDMVRDHRGMSHGHDPVPMVRPDCNSMEETFENMADDEVEDLGPAKKSWIADRIKEI